jgi:hypothetical protein
MTDEEQSRRIAALTEEIEALKRSLPAHSLKPALLIRIEAPRQGNVKCET